MLYSRIGVLLLPLLLEGLQSPQHAVATQEDHEQTHEGVAISTEQAQVQISFQQDEYHGDYDQSRRVPDAPSNACTERKVSS